MDPGYHKNIKELLIDNCNYLNIPVHIFESGIFKVVDDIAKDYPCYIVQECAVVHYIQKHKN